MLSSQVSSVQCYHPKCRLFNVIILRVICSMLSSCVSPVQCYHPECRLSNVIILASLLCLSLSHVEEVITEKLMDNLLQEIITEDQVTTYCTKHTNTFASLLCRNRISRNIRMFCFGSCTFFCLLSPMLGFLM